MGIVKEFKEFIAKGSMIDLAVGVIMGAAITAVVNSLVADIIMPVIGLLTGNRDFSTLKIVLKPETVAADGTVIVENAIRYGALIQAIISFLLVALVVFLIIKGVNKLRERSKKEEEVAEPGPTTEELLKDILVELRRVNDDDAAALD